MKKEKFVHGQKIVVEGSPIDSILFVDSGEFEIKKTLYIHKSRSSIEYKFLRYISSRDKKFLKKLLDPDTKILYSDSPDELEMLKITTKGLKKVNMKISSIGGHEIFGLIESFVDCPYAITTIT